MRMWPAEPETTARTAESSAGGEDATAVLPDTATGPKSAAYLPPKDFLAMLKTHTGLASVDPGWNTPLAIVVAKWVDAEQGTIDVKGLVGLTVAEAESLRQLKVAKRLSRLISRSARLRNALPKYVGAAWWRTQRQLHRVKERIQCIRRFLRNRTREVRSVSRKILETCCTVAIYPRLAMNRLVHRRGRRLSPAAVQAGTLVAPSKNRRYTKMNGKVWMIDVDEAYTSRSKGLSGTLFNVGSRRRVRVNDVTMTGAVVFIDMNRDLLGSVGNFFASVWAIEVLPPGSGANADAPDPPVTLFLMVQSEHKRKVREYRQSRYVDACTRGEWWW
jgi:hypothetical protein